MIPSISLAWPPKPMREFAANCFDAATKRFEDAVDAFYAEHLPAEEPAVTSDGAAPNGGAELGASARGARLDVARLDVARLWTEVVQNGAPPEVRANAWLTLTWAFRCIRREEPRLFWAAIAAAAFIGSAWVYDLARAFAELLAG